MRLIGQNQLMCQTQTTKHKQLMLYRIFLFSLLLTGCVAVDEPIDTKPLFAEKQVPAIEHQKELENKQIEIQRLEKKLAEKNVLIKQISAREPELTEVIQASSKEIIGSQVELYKLATKTSSASLISEAEVATNYVKQQLTEQSDMQLLEQAKFMLDTAIANYAQDDYAKASYYASQAHEFVNMLSDQERDLSSRPTIRFSTPIILQTTTNTNLRREPSKQAQIINVLKEGTVLTVSAYQGDWLMVQTDIGTQGWVFNSLVGVIKDD